MKITSKERLLLFFGIFVLCPPAWSQEKSAYTNASDVLQAFAVVETGDLGWAAWHVKAKLRRKTLSTNPNVSPEAEEWRLRNKATVNCNIGNPQGEE
jgi:hypothetical protein